MTAHAWADGVCQRCWTRAQWPGASRSCPVRALGDLREMRKPAEREKHTATPPPALPWHVDAPPDAWALVTLRASQMETYVRLRDAILARGQALTTAEAAEALGLTRVSHVHDRLRHPALRQLFLVADSVVRLVHPGPRVETTAERAKRARRARPKKPKTEAQRAKAREYMRERRADMTIEERRAEWLRHQRARRARLREQGRTAA